MSTNIKDVVKEKYGQAALRVVDGGSSCCGASAPCGTDDPITSRLYDETQAAQIPEEALKAWTEALMARPSTHSFPAAEFEAMYRANVKRRNSYISQFIEPERAAAE